MSTVKSNGVEVKNVLVAKIMAILKLDDAGRLEKFLDGEAKKFNSKIKAIEMNKKTAALELELKLGELDSKIEDAEAAVEDSYTAVKLENINTNEAMADFSERYWNNIDSKTAKLARLNDEKVAVQKAYDEDLKQRDEKIATIKSRIAKISQVA